MDNIFLQLTKEPFLFLFYTIAAINLLQGLVLSYKSFKGYGALSPMGIFLKILNFWSSSTRIFPYFTYALVEPKNATKNQRYLLLIYTALFLLSIVPIISIGNKAF